MSPLARGPAAAGIDSQANGCVAPTLPCGFATTAPEALS